MDQPGVEDKNVTCTRRWPFRWACGERWGGLAGCTCVCVCVCVLCMGGSGGHMVHRYTWGASKQTHYKRSVGQSPGTTFGVIARVSSSAAPETLRNGPDHTCNHNAVCTTARSDTAVGRDTNNGSALTPPVECFVQRGTRTGPSAPAGLRWVRGTTVVEPVPSPHWLRYAAVVCRGPLSAVLACAVLQGIHWPSGLRWLRSNGQNKTVQ